MENRAFKYISALTVCFSWIAQDSKSADVHPDPDATTSIETLGYETPYVLTGVTPRQGHAITVSVRVRQTDCSNPNITRGSSRSYGTNNSWNGFGHFLTFGIPGTFAVEGVISYIQGAQVVDVVIVTRTVIIAKPTAVLLNRNQNVNLNYDPNDPANPNFTPSSDHGGFLYFQLMSGGSVVGIMTTISGQEKCTQWYVRDQFGFLVRKTDNDFPDWVPPIQYRLPLDDLVNTKYFVDLGPSPYVGLSIFDYKSVGPVPAGTGPTPGVLFKYLQENRAVWNDFAGTQQTASLGLTNITITATNAPGWRISGTSAQP